MKNALKRSLSILLAITIIFSSAYVGLGEIDFSRIFAVRAKAASESDLSFTLNDDGQSYSVTHCSMNASGEIVIPKTYNGFPVTSIGDYAFDWCTSLTSIIIGDSVTSIGDRAFFRCTSLTSITIGDSVTSIGIVAFERCDRLTSINVNENNVMFSSIDGVLFDKDKKTLFQYPLGKIETSYTISDSVTSIGNYAFLGCVSLTSITIGDNVTSIGDCAFNRCYSLTSINVNENNEMFSSIDGVLIDKDKKTLVQYPLGKIETSYTIPDSVTDIGAFAFGDCTGLTSITIGDNVTSIGDWAFNWCTSLTSITIPDSVTSIGDYAFYYCESLTSITIGDSVTDIGAFAFGDCTGLTSITIPDSVIRIGSNAFEYCDKLTSITLPDSVTSIGAYAFWNTAYYNNNSNWGNNVLYINNHLIKAKTSITGACEIKNGTKSIAGNAFDDCTSLTSITIPDSVTSIGDYAFYYCSKLKYVFYSSTEENWSKIQFGTDNSYILNASIHYSSTGEHSFSNEWVIDKEPTCTEDGSKSRHCSRCDEKSDITSIVATGHNYVGNICSICGQTIGMEYLEFELNSDGQSYSVTDCNSDASGEIILSKTYKGFPVTSIGNYAFYNCDSLTSITIPNSVTSMGDYAFYNCSSLTKVNISDVGAWCEIKFSNTYSNPLRYARNLYLNDVLVTDLIIPEGVTTISNYAFFACTSFTTITIPGSVTSIGGSAFNGCISLTKVNISDIAAWCEIEFSDSTSNPLYYAKNLYLNNILVTDLVIPSSVTSIGNYAFDRCENLASITIPDSVTSIGDSAFEGCTKLKYVFYSGTEEDWSKIQFGTSNSYLLNTPIHYSSIGEHSFGEWQVRTEPTCTENGIEYRICSVCKKEETKTIPLLGHNFSNEWTIDKAETCTEAGSKSHHCTRCSVKKDVTTIDAKGHNFGSWYTITEATCTTDGIKYRTCSTCLKEERETIAKLGHNFSNEWTIDKEATCTEAGSKSYHCTRCSEKKDVTTIDAKGHSYSDWIIDLNATCTDDGSKHKTCSICGDVVIETIYSNGHSYSTEWTVDVEPTCTEEGSKSHHCIICDDKIDVTVILSSGHNYVVSENLSVHPHTISYKCSYCEDEKTETPVISYCIECNFTITAIDSSSYKLILYIGTETDVVIPTEYNGYKITTIANSCFKNNKNITSVKIPEDVTSIGSLAFMSCTSLEKVYIPASVTSIGTQAFYGFTGTIYCTKNSFAHEYAVANNIDYVLLSISETETTRIDYDNFLIYTSVQSCADILDILDVSENAIAIPTASYVYGNLELYGTGTIVTVFDGDEFIGDFTLIVEGDTNGDGVCNVLDVFEAERASSGHIELEGAFAMAADSNSDDTIDINDYQAIVNKALAS